MAGVTLAVPDLSVEPFDAEKVRRAREELGQVRREVRTLRMERDILRKATAFVAKVNA